MLTTSLIKVTVGVLQPSVVVTDEGLGAGTVGLQPERLTVAGHVMVGGVVSTVLVIDWVHSAVLPHASVALYLLVVVSVHPDTFITSLIKVTVGVPHASVAVTEDGLGAGTVGLHPGKLTVAGHVMVGGVVSIVLVIDWVHSAVLPHASVALYLLVVVSVHPDTFTISLIKVTVGVPHASVAVTEDGLGAGTVGLHPDKLTVAGQVIVGGVVSMVLVIDCVHSAVLPHASVALYLLVVVSVHPDTFTTSLIKVTVGVPHASVAVTEDGLGAGTVGLHPGKLTVAGQVIVGGVVSTVLVIDCVHSAVLPHASVALYLLVVVSVHPVTLTTSLIKVTVGVLQPSVAVTEEGLGAGTAGLQPVRLTVAGQVMVGGVISTVLVMV